MILYNFQTNHIENKVKTSSISILNESIVDEIKYISEAKNGMVEIIYHDGSKYFGEVQDQKKHGKGKLELSNGESYEGYFKMDNMDGFGKYITEPLTYEGNWQNGLQNGKGVETWQDGSTFKGEFKNGVKHGKGIYEWDDGAKYDGQWRNGEINGVGIFHFKTGARYDGQWKNGKRHGKGEFVNAKGQHYVGDFKEDKKDGRGILTFTNKQIYDGEFKDNKPHGEGVLHYPDGNSVKGRWEGGKKVETY